MTDLNDEHREGRALRSSDAVVLDLEEARAKRERDQQNREPMPSDDAPHPASTAAPKKPAPQLPPALPDLCKTLPGKHKRIPTYCEPLDRITHGGFQTGRIVMIGGPPGVTKTGWALSMAYDMARRGVERMLDSKHVVVAFAACDEARDGLLSRLGQMHGVSRESLDDEDVSVSEPAWAYVAEQLAQVPTLLLFDTRAEGECTTVDEILELAAQAAAALEARLVVVLDSIQTAPFVTDQFHEDERPRLEARMKTLHAFVNRKGIEACVVAISELNRAGYSQGATADMGSFAGSRALEYTTDLALAMKRVPDPHKFVVDVTPLKNRLGGELDAFTLHRTNRCRFEPLDAATSEEEPAHETAMDAAKYERMALQVEQAILRAKGPIESKNALCSIVAGRKQAVMRVVDMMLAAGRIEGGKGSSFRVASTPQEGVE